jgi:DNA-binding response OmpR family regulator
MRILVVDDEAYVRAGLERVLTAAGDHVVCAPDAEAAREVLRDAAFDIVIIDVVLPGIGGMEAIAAMREALPSLRIIAISGGGGIGLAQYRPDSIATCAYLAACREAGAHGVLKKPFETRELRALIDGVMTAGVTAG